MTFTDVLRRIFRRPAIVVAVIAVAICFDQAVTSSDLTRAVIFGVGGVILAQLVVLLLRRER